MNEFDLIKKYFSSFSAGFNIEEGIGDDCALVNIPKGETLAISTDTLVENIHFFKDVDPYSLGFKSLAVNISDLAAMGAKPLGFTLALTLPDINENFLEKFSKGLLDLAKIENIPLIGGDTTKGPLSITITVLGSVDKLKAFKRKNAQENDNIYVSGFLGGASLGVAIRYKKESVDKKSQERAFKRLDYPIARTQIVDYLKNNNISCALDLSDGLISDLNHILNLSDKYALININDLPFDSALESLPIDKKLKYALSGGEDYELCFCGKLKEDKTQITHQNFYIESFKLKTNLDLCEKNLPITKIGKIITFDEFNEIIKKHHENNRVYGRIVLVGDEVTTIPHNLSGFSHF